MTLNIDVGLDNGDGDGDGDLEKGKVTVFGDPHFPDLHLDPSS